MTSSITTRPGDEVPGSALIFGCGYLGRRVAAAWAGRGIATWVVTRSAAKAQEWKQQGLMPIVSDIADPDSRLDLPAADVVLWCVGFDRQSGRTREQVHNAGLERIVGLLSSSLPPGRVVYVSSTGVYGDAGGDVVDELTVPAPNSESGRVCLAGEQIIAEFSEKTGGRGCILRLGGIYGPGRLLRRVEDLRNGIPIEADPSAWLNLIHVDDAAAVIDAVSCSASAPRLLNVVSPKPVTRGEYYSLLARLVDAPPPVFAPEAASETGRGSSNRRVLSRSLAALSMKTRFDELSVGLLDAVRGTPGVMAGELFR